MQVYNTNSIYLKLLNGGVTSSFLVFVLFKFHETLFPFTFYRDLHANDIEHLTSGSFENLPQLKELRLHSQKTPMKSIAYDAWDNIGDELVDL